MGQKSFMQRKCSNHGDNKYQKKTVQSRFDEYWCSESCLLLFMTGREHRVPELYLLSRSKNRSSWSFQGPLKFSKVHLKGNTSSQTTCIKKLKCCDLIQQYSWMLYLLMTTSSCYEAMYFERCTTAQPSLGGSKSSVLEMTCLLCSFFSVVL